MGIFRWADRNLWSVSVVVFLAVELGFVLWSMVGNEPVLLATAAATTRQAVYSSLTGSASALLGLALAAVAILVTFALRSDRAGQASQSERKLAHARTVIAGSLLAASFFMLVVAIVATIGIAVDVRPVGNTAITTLIEAGGIASVAGLLVGGFGLALVIVERARH